MKPYSKDLRDRVVAAMASGRSCREVGAQFGIAPSTAGNWHRQYRRTRSYAPLTIGGDRRWKLAGDSKRENLILSAVISSTDQEPIPVEMPGVS